LASNFAFLEEIFYAKEKFSSIFRQPKIKGKENCPLLVVFPGYDAIFHYIELEICRTKCRATGYVGITRFSRLTLTIAILVLHYSFWIWNVFCFTLYFIFFIFHTN